MSTASKLLFHFPWSWQIRFFRRVAFRPSHPFCRFTLVWINFLPLTSTSLYPYLLLPPTTTTTILVEESHNTYYPHLSVYTRSPCDRPIYTPLHPLSYTAWSLVLGCSLAKLTRCWALTPFARPCHAQPLRLEEVTITTITPAVSMATVGMKMVIISSMESV